MELILLSFIMDLMLIVLDLQKCIAELLILECDFR